MCLLLLYDVEKIGYGTWLTKLTVRGSQSLNALPVGYYVSHKLQA